ncbi:MAG: heme lyase CcmF/NrfE family subunit, partial [Burkholderiales bacterium]
MIPELGQVALSLALAVALVQAFVPKAARSAAQAQLLLVAFAFGCLVYAFVGNDFSVQYVALNSNSALPLQYRIAGAWGGHEGSLLLWCLMLGVWMAAVSLF